MCLKISIGKLFSKSIKIYALIALNVTSFYFIMNLCHCQRLTFFNVPYMSPKWLLLPCKQENPFEIHKYHSIPQMQYFPNSFWLTCWSPAWTHMTWSDRLYSFNFPFIFPEHAYIFQDRMWKFFWVTNCYSETLIWMLVVEQFVLSVATFSQ